jgi:hypothetical protein
MPNVLIGNPGILNGTWKVKYVADPKVGVRKTASLTQMVAAESTATNEDSVIATAGVPQLYGIYNGIWCKEVSPEDAGPGQHPVTQADTRVWKVTSQFDSELDTNSAEINPLLRPVVISRDSVVVDEQLFYDAVSGAPIVTACGEPMFCTGPYVMPVFTFTRFEPYPYPDANILNLTGAVNSNGFRGAPVGTALMLKVRTNEVTIKNVRYEQVSYSVQFRINRYNPATTHTWREHLPHVGYWYRPSVGLPPIKNRDRFGAANLELVILNADGTQKIELPGGATVVTDFLPVNRMRSVAFPIL